MKNLTGIKKYFLLLLFSVFVIGNVNAQDRFTEIENKLKELSKDNLGLNEKVDLSLNGVAISDLIRGIATTNNLNISVDPGLNTKIVNNFSNVSVLDVLMFLCKKYDLDISFIGNIMSVSQYVAKVSPVKYTPKQPKITYASSTNSLSMDLSNDSLVYVAKEITKVSGKNVVFSPDLNGKLVNGFIQNTAFPSAMEKFAFANDLKVTPSNDNFYLIEKMESSVSNVANKNRSSGFIGPNSSQQVGINSKIDGGLVSVDAINQPINEILSTVSKAMKIDYLLYNEPKGSTSLKVENVNFDDFLALLFNGTDYTFRKDSNIYLIGERNMEALRSTKVIKMELRTIDNVLNLIPSELKKGIEIKEFRDLNSFIVSGSTPRLVELEAFLRDIDRIVPVVSIEVIIMDVRNSRAVSTGIRAGLGKSPTQTGGDVYPELNLNLGAGSINNVIDGINGLGVVNLGNVTPNFYLSLQLLETNGDIDIRSTPLISTLNGNSAKMDIADRKFYLENNSNIIQTQGTTTVNTQNYKPIDAEFSITIQPMVSGDEQITLDIVVKKQSFTEQTAGKNGPYGTTSRNFQSLIRVKNQEMVMLGGLDEDTKDESSSGIPVLSRIPVLKWIFSSRTKKKSKSKLTIFIKPTVIY